MVQELKQGLSLNMLGCGGHGPVRSRHIVMSGRTVTPRPHPLRHPRTRKHRHVQGGVTSTFKDANHAARFAMSSSLKGLAITPITSCLRAPLR